MKSKHKGVSNRIFGECKKARFADEASAQMYIDKLKKTSTRDVKPVNSYLCHRCHAWHLTSIPSKEDKARMYLEREIANLKKKVAHLKAENEILLNKIEKMKTKTVEKLLSETPDSVKEEVSKYADRLVNRSSIEWLVDELERQGYLNSIDVEAAKEMRMMELKDAFEQSRQTHSMTGFKYKTFEEYYQEKFGG